MKDERESAKVQVFDVRGGNTCGRGDAQEVN